MAALCSVRAGLTSTQIPAGVGRAGLYNVFEELEAADEQQFRKLSDARVLEYAEMYAARTA